MPPRGVPKIKTRTFTGSRCWTCRRRKVKCDNCRPRCGRCGEACEGYDVQLYWMGGEDERPCTVKRRAMVIYDAQLPEQVNLAEIDRMLVELDEMVAGAKGGGGVGGGASIVALGAFSAFALKEHEHTTSLDLSLERSSPKHLIGAPRGLPLYTDSSMAELMDNYIHVEADLLQPARHTQNPYRSLYVPKGMEAAAAAGLFVGVQDSPSPVGTALFRALVAVSASHMHRRRPDATRSHTTVSAMLSMLMEGSMTDCWIHLDGCEKLQSILRAQAADQLLAICAFMSTLSRSTDPCLPARPWEWKAERPPVSIDDFLATSTFARDNPSLEFTYGITTTLASYMELTIRLSQHLRYYHIHGLPLPLSLEQAICALHKALTAWSDTNEPLSSVSKGDSETLSLVRCHVLAFHAALVIYLYIVTGWSTDPSSTSIVRHYNRICVTNLLSAEALKTSYGAQAGWDAMAPIVWPGFVAACKAAQDERPLWRTWWVCVQRYCIGSIAVLWEIVQEVWQEDDLQVRELEPRWMKVLRRSGRRVMSGG
ncbi:fungal-specific transcription factor domain-containing protein [Aspergillus desertorum]